LAARLGVPAAAVDRHLHPDAGRRAGVGGGAVGDPAGPGDQLLQISDNVLAEDLARAVAIADNKPPTFTGAADAVVMCCTATGSTRPV